MARLAGILLMGGLVAALGACGSSAATNGGSGGESVSLEARNFQFSQTTLTLPANSTIHLTVKNAGTVHHNFSIKELGVNQDIETPGSSQTITFTTKSDATYVFFCEYHQASYGMKGTLIVGTGGSGPAAGAASPNPSPSTSAVPYGTGY
ncbi:MAG TPA: cupredoxin domain-containing protein [Candidatus Solibacter sp.]|jgi:plastocyanin|nr:cupredoxin domain-containing protein [Candidatus Solibacter sp.]